MTFNFAQATSGGLPVAVQSGDEVDEVSRCHLFLCMLMHVFILVKEDVENATWNTVLKKEKLTWEYE